MEKWIEAWRVDEVLHDAWVNRPLDSDRWVIGDIQKALADLPAADVAPVRRGWWEPYVEYLQWRCSECGFFIEVDLIDEITEKSFPNFCPNCGAQMEVAEK